MTGIEGRLRFFGFAGVLVVFSISKGPGLFILPNFITNFTSLTLDNPKFFQTFGRKRMASGLER